jgi:hypothetical protein
MIYGICGNFLLNIPSDYFMSRCVTESGPFTSFEPTDIPTLIVCFSCLKIAINSHVTIYYSGI